MAAATPRLRIETACETLGHAEVIRRCVGLIEGRDVDPEFLVILGGAPARNLLADCLPEDQSYWLRVWALRGLLWAPPGAPAKVLRRGLDDKHWRVREMACKVVARHRVDEVIDAVAGLQADRTVRVRRAADRAIRRIVEPGR